MDTTTIAEVWKPVVGYEGRYEVSSLGNARRLFRCKINGIGYAPLNPSPNRCGYVVLTLNKNGVIRNTRLHQCVLNAFIGPKPTDRHVCNHINEVKHDNRVENLEWVTHGQNVRHSIKKRKWCTGELHPQATITEATVIEMRIRYANGERMFSIAESLGVNRTTTEQAIKGHRWKHVPSGEKLIEICRAACAATVETTSEAKGRTDGK